MRNGMRFLHGLEDSEFKWIREGQRVLRWWWCWRSLDLMIKKSRRKCSATSKDLRCRSGARTHTAQRPVKYERLICWNWIFWRLHTLTLSSAVSLPRLFLVSLFPYKKVQYTMNLSSSFLLLLSDQVSRCSMALYKVYYLRESESGWVRRRRNPYTHYRKLSPATQTKTKVKSTLALLPQLTNTNNTHPTN